MKKVLYLYSEISPYLEPLFDIFVKKYSIDLHVVYLDKKKLTPYKHIENSKIKFYKRSMYNYVEINELANQIKPNFIFCVGWMDLGYLYTLFKSRRKGVDVVCGFDEIWKNTIRQNIGGFLFKFFGKLFYNYAFVSFTLQYEFARKLGFNKKNILMNALSANVKLFNVSERKFKIKTRNYPKTFIFVGQFIHRKGLKELVEAYRIYKNDLNGTWKLVLVGDGPLKNEDWFDNIQTLEFTDPKSLKEIFYSAGAFILPSREDKSPLVVHEACCSRLPLILSDSIGNSSSFLVEGLNGFSFETNNTRMLAQKLKRFDDLSLSNIIDFSNVSYDLSKRVSPEICAGSLLSILYK